MTPTTSTWRPLERARNTDWLRRIAFAVAFLTVASIAGRLHGPLFDSCEPDCSPKYLLLGDLRLRVFEFLVYVNAWLLPLLATAAAIAVMFCRPLRSWPGLIVLTVLAALVLLDGWLMRYW